MTGAPKDLRVCIDARLVPGGPGGVEILVQGLAHALSRLTDGPEAYFFLVNRGSSGWITPYLGPNSQVLQAERSAPTSVASFLRQSPKAFNAASSAFRWFSGGVTPWHSIEDSDGTVEAAGMDVMHFPLQHAFLTAIPSIYHPHDLQHRHLPENFRPRERRARDRMYRRFCDQADRVAVVSDWVRRDVVSAYEVDPSRIAIVPLAPSIGPEPAGPAPGPMDNLTLSSLPDDFVLYPAQTWPHKNHVRLVEAIALARAQRRIELVCTGRVTRYAKLILRRAAELGLSDAIHFLGFVSPGELSALYVRARAVVIPSLFEAASFPMWEAFRAGTPVASSNVTSLPSQLGDAGLLFDPYDVTDISAALLKITSDDSLRARVIEVGRKRVAALTWDRTARHFRAIYRMIAGRPLTDDDNRVLRESPTF